MWKFGKKWSGIGAVFKEGFGSEVLTNVFSLYGTGAISAEKHVAASCSVGENHSIHQFSAGRALPCIKGSYEVIISFREHPASAFWTVHIFPPSSETFPW